jgi:hypothetical protein
MQALNARTGRPIGPGDPRTAGTLEAATMSTVIAFQRSKGSAPQLPPPDLRGPAQVLLFTGVRYERLELRDALPGRDAGGQLCTTPRP